MEGDRLLNGEDVVTDDLLHLVADHMEELGKYHFLDPYKITARPVKLPHKLFLMSSTTKPQVIIDVLK